MIISIVYVIIGIIVTGYIEKRFSDKFIARKVLHLLMANWWFIRMYCIEDEWIWIGPFLAIGITYWYCKTYSSRMGMVYFCVALTIMTILTTCNRNLIFEASASILILGYADSFAAVVGRYYQLRKGKIPQKSHLGSVVFGITAAFILYVASQLWGGGMSISICLIIAFISAIFERKVFPELDNIVVPGIVFVLVHIY